MTVDVYFRMLTLELAGENYTKTEFAGKSREMSIAHLERLGTMCRRPR